MPVSGSYHYFGLNVANSSYKTVDIRENGHPPTADGVGRLYVHSASADLYFKDSAGNEIIVASAGSGVGENVFDNLIVSGTADVRGVVVNETGHLILSSSVGSMVVVSGSFSVKSATMIYFSVGDV